VINLNLKKEVICLSFIAFVVLALFGALAYTTPLGAVASSGWVTKAPSNLSPMSLNPDCVRYQQELVSNRATTQTSGGHGLGDGYMPPPFNLSHLTG